MLLISALTLAAHCRTKLRSLTAVYLQGFLFWERRGEEIGDGVEEGKHANLEYLPLKN